MKLSKTPLVNLLFIISTVSIVISSTYIWFASIKVTEIKEPYLLTYSKEQGVVFNIHKTLYHTDTDGNLISSSSFEDMGINDDLGDIVIVEDAIYATLISSRKILKCPLPLSKCEEIFKVESDNKSLMLDISVTPDNENIYLTSSNEHKIYYYTKDGSNVNTLFTSQLLRYPNGIITLNNDELIVADTNNYRVIGLKVIEDSVAEIIWEIPLNFHYSKDYRWPVLIDIDKNNNLWITVLDGYLKNGSVYISGKVEQPFSPIVGELDIKKLDIQKIKHPVAIQALVASMLISDAEIYNILEFDVDSFSYKEFGDEVIQKEFEFYKEKRDSYNEQKDLAQYFIFLSIIILIISGIIEYITTKDKKALFTQPTLKNNDCDLADIENIEPDTDGIIWLGVMPNIIKKFRRLAIIMIFILIMMAVLMIFLEGYSKATLFSLVLLSLIVLPIAWLINVNLQKQRIGIKDNYIFIENIFLKTAVDTIDNVYYTGRRIIIKDVAIGIKDGQGNPFFNEKQLSKYILSKFDKSNTVSELQLVISGLIKFDIKTYLALF